MREREREREREMKIMRMKVTFKVDMEAAKERKEEHTIWNPQKIKLITLVMLYS